MNTADKILLSPFYKGGAKYQRKLSSWGSFHQKYLPLKSVPPFEKGGQGGFNTRIKRNIYMTTTIIESDMNVRARHLPSLKGYDIIGNNWLSADLWSLERPLIDSTNLLKFRPFPTDKGFIHGSHSFLPKMLWSYYYKYINSLLYYSSKHCRLWLKWAHRPPISDGYRVFKGRNKNGLKGAETGSGI